MAWCRWPWVILFSLVFFFFFFPDGFGFFRFLSSNSFFLVPKMVPSLEMVPMVLFGL
jgi:hypothetical protein